MLSDLGSYYNISKLLTEISHLSATFDPSLRGHNLRVSLISLSIATKLTFSRNFLLNVLIASLLHDIGILFFREKEQISLLREENYRNKAIHLHALIGYRLLKRYPFFKEPARIIRDHHRTYSEFISTPNKFSFPAQILFLADRVDVWISNRLANGYSLLESIGLLREKLERGRGTLFSPKLLDILSNFYYDREAFWFNIYSEEEYAKETVLDWLDKLDFTLSIEEILKTVNLFGFIIDFKSPFTATHSSGVAQTATHLASYFHFSQEELRKMKVAGFLHDVGKILVPTEILEKPGRLTDEEFFVMKSHVYHTYRILSRFLDEDIVKWASYHHEKLNGKGYPFRLKANQIPLGSRIMAIADVFTALTEERPYKRAMSSSEALGILIQLSERGELDRQIVSVLERNLEAIDKSRQVAQNRASELYRDLKRIVGKFDSSGSRIC